MDLTLPLMSDNISREDVDCLIEFLKHLMLINYDHMQFHQIFHHQIVLTIPLDLLDLINEKKTSMVHWCAVSPRIYFNKKRL